MGTALAGVQGDSRDIAQRILDESEVLLRQLPFIDRVDRLGNVLVQLDGRARDLYAGQRRRLSAGRRGVRCLCVAGKNGANSGAGDRGASGRAAARGIQGLVLLRAVLMQSR